MGQTGSPGCETQETRLLSDCSAIPILAPNSTAKVYDVCPFPVPCFAQLGSACALPRAPPQQPLINFGSGLTPLAFFTAPPESVSLTSAMSLFCSGTQSDDLFKTAFLLRGVS